MEGRRRQRDGGDRRRGVDPEVLHISARVRGVPAPAQRQQDARVPEDGGHVAEGGTALLQPLLSRTQHSVRHGGPLPPPALLQRLHGDRPDTDGNGGDEITVDDDAIFR